MKGMTIIVKKVTQLMTGIIFIYGVYIILHGHLTPGGGFGGGAIVAGAFYLLILAYGSDYLSMTRKKEGSAVSESLAILAFLMFATFGLFLGLKTFFFNFLNKGTVGELISGGIIPLYNLFIGIEVAAALISIFFAFLIFKEELKP
jgi:multisubunit Na+/H+ antiporter MnhB subunit